MRTRLYYFEVHHIRSLIGAGFSYASIGRVFNLSYGTVVEIAEGGYPHLPRLNLDLPLLPQEQVAKLRIGAGASNQQIKAIKEYRHRLEEHYTIVSKQLGEGAIHIQAFKPEGEL